MARPGSPRGSVDDASSVNIRSDVRRRHRAVRVVLDAVLAAQERARDLAVVVVEAALLTLLKMLLELKQIRKMSTWPPPSTPGVLRRVGDAPDGSAAIPPGFRPAPARAARS